MKKLLTMLAGAAFGAAALWFLLDPVPKPADPIAVTSGARVP